MHLQDPEINIESVSRVCGKKKKKKSSRPYYLTPFLHKTQKTNRHTDNQFRQLEYIIFTDGQS